MKNFASRIGDVMDCFSAITGDGKVLGGPEKTDAKIEAESMYGGWLAKGGGFDSRDVEPNLVSVCESMYEEAGRLMKAGKFDAIVKIVKGIESLTCCFKRCHSPMY